MTTCEGSVQVSSSELRALIASQYETHAHRLHVEALERHTKFQEDLRVSTSRSLDGVLEHHKKMHEDLPVAFTKKHAGSLERVQDAEHRVRHLSHTPPPPPPCNGSSDSTQFIHQCDQNFHDSQMYISAVNFPLVFLFSVRRHMSPVSARPVTFVFRDFAIGII